jgi:hypothetical protein
MISQRAIYIYLTGQNKAATAIELVKYFDCKPEEVLEPVYEMVHEDYIDETKYHVFELNKRGKCQWKRIQNDEIANARENWRKRYWLPIAVGSYGLGFITKFLIELL